MVDGGKERCLQILAGSHQITSLSYLKTVNLYFYSENLVVMQKDDGCWAAETKKKEKHLSYK